MTSARMTAVGRLPIAALLAIAIALVVLLELGGTSFEVRLQLANADGLINGSQVKIGGVPAGSVSSLHLTRGDVVEADLQLDTSHAITDNASAAIVPSDLLGSMYVQLTPGRGARASSGVLIPASQVSYPVQLDQVLNMLDANTRTRLGILINEAGVALTGRRADFNRLLDLLPNDFSDGTRLLGQVISDNHTLADLIQHSSRFVAALVPQRKHLVGLIHAVAQTMTTTAQQQADLRHTLARAPGTLASAQRFLADLRSASVPLGPAARALTATAPELTTTLDALPAFQRAATPTLNVAARAAPLLSELAVQATPVIAAAKPTVHELASFAQASGPLSAALNASIDNTLGVIDGWARSIQARDDIGHVFHGLAILDPEFVRSLSGQLGNAQVNVRSQHRPDRTPPADSAPTAAPPTAGGTPTPASPGTPTNNTPAQPLSLLQSTLRNLLDPKSATTGSAGQPTGSLSQLLKYLLSP